MNYADNLKAVAALAGDSSYEQDADFITVLPTAITYAENRILRELDLLSTRVTDNSGLCTANSRTLELPTAEGTFIVLEVLRPIVDGVFGKPLLPCAREVLDSLYPSESAPTSPSVPEYWAPIDQASVLIAPAPDQNYPMSCFGTQRPATLGPQDTTGTFISTQLPDLFLAAQMCWLIGGWQKNWSPQANDPATAMGWEAEYTKLRDGAGVEQLRMRLASNGWGSRLPSKLATPRQT